MNNTNSEREVWIDWMRIFACFLVMVVHSTEPFYLGGDGALVLTKGDAFWVALSEAIARSCVPIFVVASSFLQFPLHYSTREFFKRRAIRILVPFFVWTVAYAIFFGEPAENFRELVFNFNYSAGHLWFVYMLIGLYLLMPLLSPWAEKVGKKELIFFMFLCFLTSFFPFIRERCLGDSYVCVYGPTGIPMQASYPLWGESSWNEFGLFHYLSGFVGYLLFGLYLRRFAGEYSWRKTLAIALPCLAAGALICGGGFYNRILATAGGTFPCESGLMDAVRWETPLYNNTVGVVLSTIGWVILLRKATCDGWIYQKIVLPVSKASYGMYLCHMFALVWFSGIFRAALGIGSEGSLGAMTTPVTIILTAVCSYVTVAIVCVLVQKIPKVGKFVVG